MRVVKQKESKEYLDKLGRPLKLGDVVASFNNGSIEICVIMKFNAIMVGVDIVRTSKWSRSHMNRYPNDLVLVDAAAATLYILKNS